MGFFLFQTEECNRLHIRAHPILFLFVHPTLNKHHSLSLSVYEGLGDWCCFGAHRNGPSAHMKECHASRSRRLMSNLIICFMQKHHHTCLQTSAKANMKGLGMKRFGLSTQLKQTNFKNLAEQVQFFCINILSGNICPCLDMSVRIKKTATDKQQTYSKIISWKLLWNIATICQNSAVRSARLRMGIYTKQSGIILGGKLLLKNTFSDKQQDFTDLYNTGPNGDLKWAIIKPEICLNVRLTLSELSYGMLFSFLCFSLFSCEPPEARHFFIFSFPLHGCHLTQHLWLRSYKLFSRDSCLFLMTLVLGILFLITDQIRLQ